MLAVSDVEKAGFLGKCGRVAQQCCLPFEVCGLNLKSARLCDFSLTELRCEDTGKEAGQAWEKKRPTGEMAALNLVRKCGQGEEPDLGEMSAGA